MCRQASSEAAFGFSACIVVDWKKKTSSFGAEIRQLYGSMRKGVFISSPWESPASLSRSVVGPPSICAARCDPISSSCLAPCCEQERWEWCDLLATAGEWRRPRGALLMVWVLLDVFILFLLRSLSRPLNCVDTPSLLWRMKRQQLGVVQTEWCALDCFRYFVLWLKCSVFLRLSV